MKGIGNEPIATLIYEGDEVLMSHNELGEELITEHKTSFVNKSKDIIGVYATCVVRDIKRSAVMTMKDSWRAGIPNEDKTTFISTGIYNISRNPAFLGFDLMYVGICLIYCNILTIVFTLFAIIMLHFQILQEEKFLEKAFGNEYIDYKKKVFRYLGRK